MRDLHEITADEATLTKAAPLGVVPLATNDRYPAPYFVDKVKRFIFSDPHFGATAADRERKLFQGGLTIETTLDPQWQQEADTSLHGILTDPTDPPGALVAIDPRDGHVKAYTSSLDYFDTDPAYRFAAFRKLDLADARDASGIPQRSPGSTFKPFVLATALEQGIPLTRRYNGPHRMLIPLPRQAPWDLSNFDTSEDYGRINLVEATVNSVNTVFGQLVLDVGPANVANTARSMGIDNAAMTNDPSIAIGSQAATVEDMASAYGAFATDGIRHPEVFVTRVTDRNGRVLYGAHPAPKQVLPTDVARTVTGVLQQVVQRGTGINARIGRPAAGKTGSAENNTDAWFVGYTPELVAAVWVGEPESNLVEMKPPRTRITVLGGTFPARIWQIFASSALATVPASTFPVPDPSTTTTTAPRSTPTTRALVPGIYSVVGKHVIPAVQELTQDGYQVRTVRAPSRRYPPNYVTAQDPPAGSPLRPGGTITLTVASGPPRAVTVPGVLGMPADQAIATIRAAGLVPDLVVEVQPDPVPPDSQGRIWKQNPASGIARDEGTTVRIWGNP
jgi:penicillin-binding protein 1A